MCESEGREKKTDKTRVAMLEQTVDRMGLRKKKKTHKKKANVKPKAVFLATNEESVEIFSSGQDRGRKTKESLRVRAPDRQFASGSVLTHSLARSLTPSSCCYSSGRLFVFCPNRDYESAA